jgi:metallo-beta-lactamase class B
MKKTRYVFFSLVCFFSALIFAIDGKCDVSITEIRSNVFYVVHSYPWPANSLITIMENGDILLVDTPYTPDATEEVLTWIREKYGDRNIVAINTHFHVDRLGGNEALLKHNIPIYSSELTIQAIKERGASSIDWTVSHVKDATIKQYFLNFKYVNPTHIFDSKEGLTLKFGNEIAKIEYYGIGHSVDNLFVFLPKKHVIFGGCAILSAAAKTPGNVSDGNKDEWNKLIPKIETHGYDCVVPGHGDVGGIELLKHTAEITAKK